MNYNRTKPYYACVVDCSGHRRGETHHASFAEAHHYYLELCQAYGGQGRRFYVDIGNWDNVDIDCPSGLTNEEREIL